MTEWEVMTTKILQAIDKLDTKNDREMIFKTAVYIYLYKSFESEEIFNDNLEKVNVKVKK